MVSKVPPRSVYSRLSQNHRCQHEKFFPRRKKLHSYSSQSVLQEDYVSPYDLDCIPPKPFKPIQNLPFPPEKMDTSTVYEEQFVHKPIPPVFRYVRDKFYPPTGKFQNDTEYRRNYIDKPIIPTASARPVRMYEPNVPMENMTTNKNSYQPPNKATAYKNRIVCVRKPAIWESSKPPFQGATSHQEEFQPPVNVDPVCPTRPLQRGLWDKTPLQCNTQYNDEYTPKDAMVTRRKPPKDKSGLLQMDTRPNVLDSTIHRDYVTHDGAGPAESCRPARLPPDDLPMDMKTTYNEEFWHRMMERPRTSTHKRSFFQQKAKPRPNECPKTTVYQDSFSAPDLTEKPAKRKVPYFTFSDDLVYRNSTVTRDSYPAPPPGSGPPASFRPIRQFMYPKEAVERLSTMQADYRGEYYAPSKPCINHWDAEMQIRFRNAPMNLRTEYKDRYRGYFRKPAAPRHMGTVYAPILPLQQPGEGGDQLGRGDSDTCLYKAADYLGFEPCNTSEVHECPEDNPRPLPKRG